MTLNPTIWRSLDVKPLFDVKSYSTQVVGYCSQATCLLTGSGQGCHTNSNWCSYRCSGNSTDSIQVLVCHSTGFYCTFSEISGNMRKGLVQWRLMVTLRVQRSTCFPKSLRMKSVEYRVCRLITRSFSTVQTYITSGYRSPRCPMCFNTVFWNQSSVFTQIYQATFTLIHQGMDLCCQSP